VCGVDWEFVGSGIYVCRGGAGECYGGRDVAGDNYDSWGFVYGDYDSDVGGAVGAF
jgi:hypothetical protein